MPNRSPIHIHDGALHRKIKAAAALEGIPMWQLTERLLRAGMLAEYCDTCGGPVSDCGPHCSDPEGAPDA